MRWKATLTYGSKIDQERQIVSCFKYQEDNFLQDKEKWIIILKSDCTMAPVDALVVGEILSVEDVFQRLISYDEEQCLETFLCGLCTIYFSEHPVRENTTHTIYIGH